ncbi:DUF1610 domain-containing protein [archaeon]|nr:DUF1610 domain-containing protein [archaeon]
MSENCISCSKNISSIDNSVIFDCPECGEAIVRCGECRRQGINYKCKCGFKGW